MTPAAQAAESMISARVRFTRWWRNFADAWQSIGFRMSCETERVRLLAAIPSMGPCELLDLILDEEILNEEYYYRGCADAVRVRHHELRTSTHAYLARLPEPAGDLP